MPGGRIHGVRVAVEQSRMVPRFQIAPVHATRRQIRLHPEKKVPPIRKEVGGAMTLFAWHVEIRDLNNRSSPRWDAGNSGGSVRAEKDHIISIPGSTKPDCGKGQHL